MRLSFNPQQRGFRPPVYRHHKNHSAGRRITCAERRYGAVHLIAANGAEFSRRPPVQHKMGKWVFLVPLRMPLPIRVGIVDSVRSLKILLCEGSKKPIPNAPFTPETKPAGWPEPKAKENKQ